jgi:hypothetical protein
MRLRCIHPLIVLRWKPAPHHSVTSSPAPRMRGRRNCSDPSAINGSHSGPLIVIGLGLSRNSRKQTDGAKAQPVLRYGALTMSIANIQGSGLPLVTWTGGIRLAHALRSAHPNPGDDGKHLPAVRHDSLRIGYHSLQCNIIPKC